MTKLKNFINPNSERDEFDITDFDNTDGWHWKDVDHLIDMGFQMSGDTRLKLSDKQDFDENLNVEIYKQKSTGDYFMILNGRKHVFNVFVDLINFIDDKKID
jgi:hypothetical protein